MAVNWSPFERTYNIRLRKLIIIQGTGVMSMYTNKQDKNQKLRTVQGLYRKKRNKNRTTDKETKIWTVFISICILAVFFFFVTSILFDIGVPLPPFFGV